MLKLSGVPTQARDQSEFSQLMRAWLNKVRSSPAPDLAVVQRQHDDRQAFEVSREHACRINLEATEQAQYRKDINTLARAAEARQAPEKPPVKIDAAPEWACKWITDFSPLASLIAGAAYLARDTHLPQVKRDMFKSLIPNGHNIPFSTMNLIGAMPEEWLPKNANGDTFNKNTISEQLKRAYPDFKWAEGRTNSTYRKEMKPLLEQAVREGLPIVRDGDAHEYVPDNVLRLAS